MIFPLRFKGDPSSSSHECFILPFYAIMQIIISITQLLYKKNLMKETFLFFFQLSSLWQAI
jgi:hypothetical protein